MGIFYPQFTTSKRTSKKASKSDDLRLTMLSHQIRFVSGEITLVGRGMSKRRIGPIDLDTGEILGNEGFVAYLSPKRRYGFDGGWVAMAQGALALFVEKRKELGEEGLAVLLALMARLDFENLLVLSQADLGREIGMKRENINRSIKRLVAMGALLEGPRIGIYRSYRLNPQFGWKGSAKSHVTALADARADRMRAAGISEVIEGGQPEGTKKAPPT